MIVQQVFVFLLIAAVLGLLAHWIGEALPRRCFHAERFPYRAFGFEHGGKIYQRFGIERWKDQLPDKSRFVPSMVKKSVRAVPDSESLLRLVQETCVAECVHWTLLLLSPLFLLFMNRIWGSIATALYALSHIPFIMIQRYNRPRLIKTAQRLALREKRHKGVTEYEDPSPVQQ